MEKKNYKLAYFPFTHGDSIMHQRRMWKEMQQADLAHLAEKDLSSPIKRKPLNTLTDDELFMIFQSTGPHHMTSPYATVSEFVGNSATPQETYMRPSYPYRIKNNDSMVKALDGAWRRFEEQLKKEEDVKKQQAENFHMAVVRDQQAIEGEIVRKLNMQQENRKDLDIQIRQKEDVAAFEKEVNR